MPEEDKILIMKAELLSCHQWYEIRDLIPLAKSDKAKEELRSIERYKYHREEFLCGCL